MQRCGWVTKDADYIHYHDTQWGRPVTCSQQLFEKLCLDGQQAGLSWLTILRKTETYREAYANWHIPTIASFDEQKVEQLLQNPGIIRNRLKVNSVIRNARAYLKFEQDNLDTNFAEYLWSFVGHQPIVNQWRELSELPAQTPESEAMSKALKKLGFNFVGPTICYAFMQAVGMVIDHEVGCPQYQECCELAQAVSFSAAETA